MKIFGQPESYSDMLQRIFYTTVASGVVCTVLLAKTSPTMKAIIDSVSTEADIGPVKGLKVLYVLLPLVVALTARMLRLHDKISDVLRIRFLFDTRYVLFPLAQLTGHTLTKTLKRSIGSKRVDAMYAVFYPYAGFNHPTIDKQLVRTAADNWCWFWVIVESAFIFGVTAIILQVLHKPSYVYMCVVIIFVQMCLLMVEWFACRRSAKRQVHAILADNSRRSDISAYFRSI